MSIISTKYRYDKLGNRNMVIDPKENVTYFNYDLQGRLRNTISPDGNVAYYEYNKVGSLTSKKDENGDTIDYTYDKVYRLTRKDYPDSTHAYFSYDAVGRRLHMQDANTLTYFVYDAGGRLTSTHDCILDKTISYTYDKVGRRDSMTDPEGDILYYDYDSVKLIRIKRNTDEEAYYAYDAGGRRNYTALGNSSYTYYNYDVNGRLTRVANHQSDESVISTFDYTLDPVGNRIAMELASGDTVYYEYDGIYQLVKEDRRDSGDALVYINYFEYDLAGNRTHLHYVDTSSDDWTYYTYNIENQLTIEETGGTATYYEYDAAGALLRKDVSGTISYYEYNYDGLMDRFNEGETVATYTFDTDSRRIEKDVDGTVSKYEYNGADVIAEYDGDDVLQATFNTPALDQNLTQKRSGNIYHYLQDGLGSVRNLIDSDETIQNTYDYLAFGSVYGTPTENVSNPFRFTSRRWDSESSLNFYRMRMYNQLVGLFLSKDPLFKGGLYHYAKNNPIMNTDSLGLQCKMIDPSTVLEKYKDYRFWYGCAMTPPTESQAIDCPGAMCNYVHWFFNERPAYEGIDTIVGLIGDLFGLLLAWGNAPLGWNIAKEMFVPLMNWVAGDKKTAIGKLIEGGVSLICEEALGKLSGVETFTGKVVISEECKNLINEAGFKYKDEGELISILNQVVKLKNNVECKKKTWRIPWWARLLFWCPDEWVEVTACSNCADDFTILVDAHWEAMGNNEKAKPCFERCYLHEVGHYDPRKKKYDRYSFGNPIGIDKVTGLDCPVGGVQNSNK